MQAISLLESLLRPEQAEIEDIQAEGLKQASPGQARNERRPGYRFPSETSPEVGVHNVWRFAIEFVSPLQG
jgi:hypothetical protein